MALDTYANLQTAINDWLWNRSESSVTDFIRLVEVEVNRTVRHRKMHKRSTASLSDQYLSLPSDFISVVRLVLSTDPVREIRLVTPDELADLRTRYSGSGRPRWYAVIGDTIEILPTPDSTYTVELTYISNVPALTDSNTSNWLLASFPDVYLYGALVEAAAYLREPEQLPVVQARFERAKLEMRRDSEGAGGRIRMQIRGMGA